MRASRGEEDAARANAAPAPKWSGGAALVISAGRSPVERRRARRRRPR
jgi:hypothetical protein